MREARERCGLGGALALRLSWYRWGRQTWLGPSDGQHDEEPHENEYGELVVKKMRDHGLAPSKVWCDGALYRVFGPMELSAVERYTTGDWVHT